MSDLTPLRALLDQVREHDEAATDGPWEGGDRWHVQGAEMCRCKPNQGPLIKVERTDINGEMMEAHFHKQEDPWWEPGIYSEGGELVADGPTAGEPNADLILHYRTAAPQLAAVVEAVLSVHQPHTFGTGDRAETDCRACEIRDDHHPWPCPTVTAMLAALDTGGGDDG